MKPSIVSNVPRGLFAQASVFGWTLFGSFTSPSTGFAGCAVSRQLLWFECQLDCTVPELWSLEAIGISPMFVFWGFFGFFFFFFGGGGVYFVLFLFATIDKCGILTGMYRRSMMINSSP